MKINGGYYISECTQETYPVSHIDTGTLYIPFDIENNEGGAGYKFKEYRVEIPVNSSIDTQVLKKIIESAPDLMGAINDTLKSVFGESASTYKIPEYKTTIVAVKERIQSENDKTFGIACRSLFEIWEPGVFKEGDVRTDRDTGYPYECITSHDSATNQGEDWTIKNRALWKPWHSRNAEYALPYEQPTGAHDMYRAGEYAIWTDGTIQRCKEDTNFSPEDYPQAWEKVEP